MFLIRYLKDLNRLWYPTLCPMCEASILSKTHFACLPCFQKFRPLQLIKSFQNGVYDRFTFVKQLDCAGALFHFTAGTENQHLLHQIKYANYTHAAAPLGKFMAQQWRDQLSTLFPMTIIPVPLHWSKKIARGFNQSELIAKAFAAELGQTYVPNALQRIRHTRTQTRKSKQERIRNVSGAFSCNKDVPIHTKRILLLDDVITSGATLSACISAIQSAYGDKHSYILISCCLAI